MWPSGQEPGLGPLTQCVLSPPSAQPLRRRSRGAGQVSTEGRVLGLCSGDPSEDELIPTPVTGLIGPGMEAWVPSLPEGSWPGPG